MLAGLSKYIRIKAYPGSYFWAPQLHVFFLSLVRDTPPPPLELEITLILLLSPFFPEGNFPSSISLSSLFSLSICSPSLLITRSNHLYPCPWPFALIIPSLCPILVASYSPQLTLLPQLLFFASLHPFSPALCPGGPLQPDTSVSSASFLLGWSWLKPMLLVPFLVVCGLDSHHQTLEVQSFQRCTGFTCAHGWGLRGRDKVRAVQQYLRNMRIRFSWGSGWKGLVLSHLSWAYFASLHFLLNWLGLVSSSHPDIEMKDGRQRSDRWNPVPILGSVLLAHPLYTK